MTLRGTSLLDNIRIGDINQVRLAQPPDVRGRLNVLDDGRIGRFGWKAQTATLVEFIAEAFRDEIGSTNPLAPRDLVRGCGASIDTARSGRGAADVRRRLSEYHRPAVPTAACLTSQGAAVFASTGCATCHTPTMFGPGSSGPLPTTIRPYSDLLLHDMGEALADGPAGLRHRSRIQDDAAVARVGSPPLPARRSSGDDSRRHHGAWRPGIICDRGVHRVESGQPAGAAGFPELHLTAITRVNMGADFRRRV